MTNEQAFAEFQYAVNHWFQFMDVPTRCKAIELTRKVALQPIGEVQHQQVVVKHVNGEPNRFKVDGRGAHFIGKVWMIHKNTRQKIRCTKEEVAEYQAKGFERGGARSK